MKCENMELWDCGIVKMRKCWIVAVMLGALTAVAAETEKNVMDVTWGDLPVDTGRLLAGDELGKWNFNFRPYGGGAADLGSDPAIVRDVVAGKSDAKPTGVRVNANADGFTLLVFCAEPEAEKAFATTNALPLPRLEIFITPSDNDNEAVATYWQFYADGEALTQYDWPVADRHWRYLLPYVRHEVRSVKGGYVFRLDVPWECVFDRLPLTNRPETFWRLQVVRWVNGGVTWGGEVHQPSGSGYIRMPAFTAAQRTAIRRTVLEKAWIAFRRRIVTLPYSLNAPGLAPNKRAPYVRTEPYVAAERAKEGPRTYVNWAEDPAFAPTYAKLVADCNALAPGLAALESMGEEEQTRFYRTASEKLFNFRYDVEAAYAAQVGRTLFAEGGLE